MARIVVALSMALALGFGPQPAASPVDRGAPDNAGQGLGCCW